MLQYLTHFLFFIIAFGMFLIDGLLLGQAIRERSLLGITIMVVMTSAYALAVGWLVFFSPLS